ncbi:hypothetical protein HK102_002956 [Quaeritorhiza haematococci]|nr:hypothetical protein HK102_002956 [Quaeritorhiza haematococci]
MLLVKSATSMSKLKASHECSAKPLVEATLSTPLSPSRNAKANNQTPRSTPIRLALDSQSSTSTSRLATIDSPTAYIRLVPEETLKRKRVRDIDNTSTQKRRRQLQGKGTLKGKENTSETQSIKVLMDESDDEVDSDDDDRLERKCVSNGKKGTEQDDVKVHQAVGKGDDLGPGRNVNKSRKQISSSTCTNSGTTPLAKSIAPSKKTSSRNPAEIQKVKKRSICDHSRNGARRICSFCGKTSTPMWRNGPESHPTLCNSCGVRWKRGKILQAAQCIDPLIQNDSRHKSKGTAASSRADSSTVAKDCAETPAATKPTRIKLKFGLSKVTIKPDGESSSQARISDDSRKRATALEATPTSDCGDVYADSMVSDSAANHIPTPPSICSDKNTNNMYRAEMGFNERVASEKKRNLFLSTPPYQSEVATPPPTPLFSGLDDDMEDENEMRVDEAHDLREFRLDGGRGEPSNCPQSDIRDESSDGPTLANSPELDKSLIATPSRTQQQSLLKSQPHLPTPFGVINNDAPSTPGPSISTVVDASASRATELSNALCGLSSAHLDKALVRTVEILSVAMAPNTKNALDRGLEVEINIGELDETAWKGLMAKVLEFAS